MCLDKIGPRLIAKTDIIAYKYGSFKFCNTEGIPGAQPLFISPSQCHRYLFNKTCRTTVKVYGPKKDHPFVTSHPEDKNMYVMEGFHTFKNKQAAIKTASKHSSSETIVVVKCTIPKGSIYYEGSFGRAKSIASNKIIINEVVWPKSS